MPPVPSANHRPQQPSLPPLLPQPQTPPSSNSSPWSSSFFSLCHSAARAPFSSLYYSHESAHALSSPSPFFSMTSAHTHTIRVSTPQGSMCKAQEREILWVVPPERLYNCAGGGALLIKLWIDGCTERWMCVCVCVNQNEIIISV